MPTSTERYQERETSTIKVQILDLSKCNQSALEYMLKNNKEDETPIGAETGYTWGIVTTNDGIYCLCSEGVGQHNPVTESDKISLDYYPKYEKSIAILPSVQVHLSDKHLMECATNEFVPLEDFIRKFGSRLETNYYTWKRQLEGVL